MRIPDSIVVKSMVGPGSCRQSCLDIAQHRRAITVLSSSRTPRSCDLVAGFPQRSSRRNRDGGASASSVGHPLVSRPALVAW